MGYVPSGGFSDAKSSVRVATTANLNLSAPGTTIDGITLAAGNRVLVKSQTTASQNGIYVWNGAAVAMARANDANSSAEVNSGMSTYVEQGTLNGKSEWHLTTPDPIVLGTTALTFERLSGGDGATSSVLKRRLIFGV